MKESIPDQHKDFELIGRFHHFELTEEELQAFEKRLETDPVLQERFRLYGEMDRHIDQQLSVEQTGDFKAILQDRADKPKADAKIRRLFSGRQWGIAATIALLLVAGLWWLMKPSVLDDSLALADYYWEATDMEHLYDSAQRGEDNRDPDQTAHTFFRSIRDYREKGQYGTIIDQLEIYKTTTPAPIPYEDDADWLLAMAYIANDQLESARFVLEQIVEAYPARREKARELLQDIEQLEASGEVRK